MQRQARPTRAASVDDIPEMTDVLESMPIGVIMLDTHGRVLRLNKQQEVYSRIDRKDVIGTLFHETWDRLFENRIYAQNYWNMINGNRPFSYVFHDIRPQFYEEKVSGIACGAPLISGNGHFLLHGLSEEVRKDKFSLEYLSVQLEQSSLFLSNLANSSPNAVVTCNAGGEITYVNTTGLTIFDYDMSDILSKPITTLFADAASIDNAKQNRHAAPSLETVCRKQTGRTFPARIQLSGFKSGTGDDWTQLYIISDISTEKKMRVTLDDRLSFEKIVTELSAKFMNLQTHRIDEEISNGLKRLGEFLKIDRSSLSQFSKDGKSLIVTHSFGHCKDPLLLGQDLAVHLPDYTAMIRNCEILSYERMLEELPKNMTQLRAHASVEDIKSHLGLPLAVGNSVVGVLGFTSIQRYRTWPREMVGRLIVLANIFANSLMRKKAQQSIDEQLKFEMFISELSASFINVPVDKIDDQITIGLEKISKVLRIDRSILAPIDEKTKVVYVSHSWTTAGAEFPDVMKAEQFPWICDQIVKGNLINYSNMDELPGGATADRKSVEAFDVKSYLSIPLRVGGMALGSLSLHSVHREIEWPKSLVHRAKLVGEIFANALRRQQNEKHLKNAFCEIKKLKDQIEAERNYLREEIKLEHNIKDIVGNSRALQYVLFKVEQVAPTDTTVLISGETGTGKELISRAIHAASTRRDRPLVKVNCATLPSHIIESELFGHEKGAFTGAHTRQIGRFELANNATLFLDEIGELPIELQAKLLRVLQDGEFERLGSPQTVKVDVRIIAATNRELETEVNHGRFRKDLWFRLNIFPLTVPPLRKRTEDIPDLVNWFTRKFGKKLGKTISRVRQADMEAMMTYDWPGNVRELANFIERAVINTNGSVLILPEKLQSKLVTEIPASPKKTMAEFERQYITEVLEEARWKIEGPGGAAEILDMHPSTLRGRMRKYKIRKPSP